MRRGIRNTSVASLNYRTGSGSDLAVATDSSRGYWRDTINKAQDTTYGPLVESVVTARSLPLPVL